MNHTLQDEYRESATTSVPTAVTVTTHPTAGGLATIERINETWNPLNGCTKTSPGCENCYAERTAYRLQAKGESGYENGFELSANPLLVQKPYSWKKPRMVFVAPMGDLFHEEVP